jgi:hypothetical protein
MKSKVLVTIAAILLLPVLSVIIMHREEAGSMTIFTLRATPLRIYCSNSGSLGLAVRPAQDRLKDPGWLITRRDSVAWSLANVVSVYLEFPYLLLDAMNPKD